MDGGLRAASLVTPPDHQTDGQILSNLRITVAAMNTDPQAFAKSFDHVKEIIETIIPPGKHGPPLHDVYEDGLGWAAVH